MAAEVKGQEAQDVEMSDGPGNGAGSQGQVAPRFEIKKWNAVAMWSWDICADTCAICRNSLNEPSIEYQVSDALGQFVLVSLSALLVPAPVVSCLSPCPGWWLL
ncbi:unnamed protein product [Choristocarpus tenellus]